MLASAGCLEFSVRKYTPLFDSVEDIQVRVASMYEEQAHVSSQKAANCALCDTFLDACREVMVPRRMRSSRVGLMKESK